MVYSSGGTQFYTAKMGRDGCKYTLIKTKEQTFKHYEKQVKVYNELSKDLAKRERKILLKTHYLWKEKKNNVVVTDNYLNATWKDVYITLFRTSFTFFSTSSNRIHQF